MSQSKDALEKLAQLSSASILTKAITRVDLQMKEAMKILKSMEDFSSASKLLTLGNLITLTSGNAITNKKLIRRIAIFIRQTNKLYQLPELTLKYHNDVIIAFMEALGGHYGTWENLIQVTVIEVLKDTNILEQKTLIPGRLFKLVEEITQRKQLEDK